jgi:phosphopentomutase
MGGVGITQGDFFRCFELCEREGYVAHGINIPKLRIYNDLYRVIHMGHGVDVQQQTPSIAVKNGIPVILIGKTADVIDAPGAEVLPEVITERVLEKIIHALGAREKGFIFANVQQTDLAGHEQDTDRFAALLELIDQKLPSVVRQLDREDAMIITGDHGNDPAIGHTNHTREKTPLILFSQGIPTQDFGERNTLADVGATVSRFFRIPLPQDGTPLT